MKQLFSHNHGSVFSGKWLKMKGNNHIFDLPCLKNDSWKKKELNPGKVHMVHLKSPIWKGKNLWNLHFLGFHVKFRVRTFKKVRLRHTPIPNPSLNLAWKRSKTFRSTKSSWDWRLRWLVQCERNKEWWLSSSSILKESGIKLESCVDGPHTQTRLVGSFKSIMCLVCIWHIYQCWFHMCMDLLNLFWQ